MPATQTASHPDGNPPTFESVWASFQESHKQFQKEMQESREQSRKEMQESREQSRKEMQESREQSRKEMQEFRESLKETERLMKEDDLRYKKEFNERLGAITNLFGDLTEAMVAPKIREKFEEMGLVFPKANRNTSVKDRVNNISFEVDIMLENGDKAMLIEVKTKLTIDRIKYHLNRLEKMRTYADLHGDKRTFLGAVAGIVVTDEVRDYALSQGFYFIEYAGETFYITAPNGKPKEW